MRVLVPLDGSDFGKAAMPVVRRLLALVPDAELHFLTVFDPHTVQGTIDHAVFEPLVASYPQAVAVATPLVVESHGEALARTHRESLAWLESLAAAECPETSRVLHVSWSRQPAAAIIALARDLDADAIVMATHGRSGLSHLLTGSVTERVIRTAGRPVLVVGPARER